jgi:hypothetical protein
MKHITNLLLAAAFSLAACNNDQPAGAEKKETTESPATDKKTAPVLDSATKAANMMAYATPGAVHKMMAGWDGNWAAEIKVWMAPDAPPMVMNSKSTNKMINSGLIQLSTHEGKWGDMPFNGVSQTGYDNHRGIFWSTWYDNFGSGLTYLEGTWDDATKTINMKGKMTDPESKQQLDLRETMKIVDENTQVMEQFLTHDGKEMKSMEITFKRAK